ncbi:MAG: TlpA family protein disulfide reductase [Treponema sp.]|jgi:thiol-disulfide isomerase/thioredoxin|nr:TlpA family protein disulfide reductase [Treponema sp.]
MKRYAILIALVGTAVFMRPGSARAETVPDPVVKAFAGAGLPLSGEKIDPIDFTLPLLNGTSQKLSDLKGKVVFLNFWATWCPPCRQEMPSIESLYQRFKSQGLEILAVDCQEESRDVSAFMRRNRFSFSAALDESGEVSNYYGITAIPTTYIVDRSGKIILKVAGSLNWNNPRIIAAFETLLKS